MKYTKDPENILTFAIKNTGMNNKSFFLWSVLLGVCFSMQEMKANDGSGMGVDFTGWENHEVPRRLEADLITVEQGTFMRPAKFESWRSIYWVKPEAGVSQIRVKVTATNGKSISFRQDGITKSVTVNNNLFEALFGLNNGKAMTEIEIIVTDGAGERSYYLDVCNSDPQRHDVVANYYGLPSYPATRNTTRALVDQITGGYQVTPSRIDFVANYLTGSQKNIRELIDPVKAINPNWHSLHYHLAIWNNQADIIINNRWSKDEWLSLTNDLFKQDPFVFLYAVNKNTGKTTWLEDLTWGANLMNISNENYYRFLLENLIYQCNSTGYESIFLDSYCLGTVYSFTGYNYINFGGGSDVPAEFSRYQHPQLGGLTWVQASEEFIARLNKDLNKSGIWLLPNLGDMRTSWDPIDYAIPNGGMLEATPVRPDNSGTVGSAHYLYDWLQSMSRTMYLTQKDRVIILQPYLDNLNNTDYRLFVLGEYLMVREDYTYLNLCINNQAQASWYPEYEIDLGAPVQTHVIPDVLFTPWKESIDKAILHYQEGDLFVRRFEKGMVILNPHRSARQYTTPTGKTCQMAVVSGGGTVPEAGIGHLSYSLNWLDIPAGTAGTVPAESALIIRHDMGAGMTETFTEKLKIYGHNGEIQVTAGTSDPIREVSVYDMQGVLLYKSGTVDCNSHTFRPNLPAGVYIIRVITGKNIENVKLFIT